MICLIVLLAVANAQTIGGSWVQSLYQTENKIGMLVEKLKEQEDNERHVLDKIDHAQMDYEASPVFGKAKISHGIGKMKSTANLVRTRKNFILKRIKSLINGVDSRYRPQLIRNLKLEKYFDTTADLLH